MFSIIIINYVFANTGWLPSKQLFSHWHIAVMATLFYGVFFCIQLFLGKRQWHIHVKVPMLCLGLLLYGLLLYIFSNVYYKSGSDLWTVDYTAKVLLGTEPYIDWCSSYYSQYPNNILITVMYSLGLQWSRLFGVLDYEHPLFIFVAFNCLISCLTTFLVAKILYRCTKNQTITVAGTIVAFVYFCLNPLNLWLYSDPFSLWIPIAMVAILVLNESAPVKVGLLTILAIFSFQIKPQNVIPVIALFCTSIIYLDRIIGKKIDRMRLAKCACIMMVCGIIAFFSINLVNYYFQKSVPIDSEKSFPPTQWFMMGLNQNTYGGWDGDDVAFAKSIEDKGERTKETFDVAVQRLKDMGISGYAKFLWRKLTRIIYDGTFGYSTSTGDWYDEVYPERNEFAAPFLRNLYYWDGRYYPILYTLLNILWVFILILCLSGAIYNLRIDDPLMFWLGISMMGLFIFELLFEAQSRHLYSHLPIFLLYGLIGLHRLITSCSVLVDNFHGKNK